jgi:hypothetical protein
MMVLVFEAPMKKARLSVYLEAQTMAQLAELAEQKQQPKSLIAEAAVISLLASEEEDPAEAVFVRRLDALSRRIERLERDHSMGVEALALLIRLWLIVTPSLSESTPAAQAKGRERYESFLETLGRRLAKGQSFLREVSLDQQCELPLKSKEAQ